MLCRLLVVVGLVIVLSLSSWVLWGAWPNASFPAGDVSDPAMIVVLGGGDGVRVRQAARLASEFPDIPLLVTGDGEFLLSGIVSSGVPESRVRIESAATSTWENAAFTQLWVKEAGAGQLALVTNDFHGPRAQAVFRKMYPDREIVVATEQTIPPYNKWQECYRRRERAAAIYYVLRYGV